MNCTKSTCGRFIETSTGEWEVVIGLEVHAQIISGSKLFSSSSTKFGTSPNENVSFIDAALPGVLPVINSVCIDQAIKTGLGLNGSINLISYFDRKNYFYADLPSGYQITQFYHPIISGGYVDIETEYVEEKTINIDHIHIEQDAGKSIHDQSPTKSFIDLNRAGIALMEIVTKPDMRSAEEASIFLRKLRSILRYLKTCDGNMDEGSLRADVNVSVHRPGTEYGTRAEVKNVNSIKFLTAAVNFEVERQINLLESGKEVEQETRLFDSSTGKTKSMRSKEDATDYRYFPEPDLPPLILEQSRIDAIRETIPELPDAKAARFQRDYNLQHYDACLISSEKEVADFFECALMSVGPDKDIAKILSNWIVGELFALFNKHDTSIVNSQISPQHMGELMLLIKTEVISGKIAKDVLEFMWETQKSPSIIVQEKGWQQITCSDTLTESLREVLVEHADKVEEYKNGKDKLFGFFIGQAMKKTKGKANPQILNEILGRLLSE
ncbi:MAG: Asp-tRNA(Asn)/Glu-tRNA(Gln) amidotransferase subunit GatB [Holosporaceae bacterium]|jgi:aspartyl-tRNA(Asn)/glutamyl-tRNA(Gln) amidotransferase subunit B|nr:Asp-tRNA(Asn)/Glu-tRNA(Gln) amidotransferase subunit GatB [Holosporaceae bacterium]